MAALCAAFVGWDALRRPSPERVTWTAAFLLFTVAAACEVIGSAIGWSPTLARVYYLTGAVLVVGGVRARRALSLAAGSHACGHAWHFLADRCRGRNRGLERADRLGAINGGRLASAGTRAVPRCARCDDQCWGTMVLAGGALYSAWTLRAAGGSGQRAAGCVLIAVGTVVVALGRTLSRFGRPGYLYLAMVLGIAIIFAGVVLATASGTSGDGACARIVA